MKYSPKFRVILAPRGYEKPDGQYRSLFGFVWWFWIPRLHTQTPDTYNPAVFRFIWLCFALNLDLWTPSSISHRPF